MATSKDSFYALYDIIVHMCEGRSAAEIEAMFDAGQFGTQPRIRIVLCLQAGMRCGAIAKSARFI